MTITFWLGFLFPLSPLSLVTGYQYKNLSIFSVSRHFISRDPYARLFQEKKKSENCIDIKEKMLSNYSFHHMLFFKIYVDMGEFEILMWLNPKKCCLENSPRVCTVSTSHLVSRRAACISWPSTINLPRGQSRECRLKGNKDFFFPESF